MFLLNSRSLLGIPHKNFGIYSWNVGTIASYWNCAFGGVCDSESIFCAISGPSTPQNILQIISQFHKKLFTALGHWCLYRIAVLWKDRWDIIAWEAMEHQNIRLFVKSFQFKQFSIYNDIHCRCKLCCMLLGLHHQWPRLLFISNFVAVIHFH
jgi:hypothetical protein